MKLPIFLGLRCVDKFCNILLVGVIFWLLVEKQAEDFLYLYYFFPCGLEASPSIVRIVSYKS
jgi:hypothetical protein